MASVMHVDERPDSEPFEQLPDAIIVVDWQGIYTLRRRSGRAGSSGRSPNLCAPNSPTSEIYWRAAGEPQCHARPRFEDQSAGGPSPRDGAP
jgi:hypothetical protein